MKTKEWGALMRYSGRSKWECGKQVERRVDREKGGGKEEKGTTRESTARMGKEERVRPCGSFPWS